MLPKITPGFSDLPLHLLSITSFDSPFHLKVERFSDMTYLISADTEYSNLQYGNVKSNNAFKIIMKVIYLHTL